MPSNPAGRPDEIADHEHRADAEIDPQRGVEDLIGRGLPVSRSSDTRSGARRERSQGSASRLWPRNCSGLPVASMPRATWTSAKIEFGVEAYVKCGIGAGRLAQQLQIGRSCSRRRSPPSCLGNQPRSWCK
jgi:hypothetical protein